MKRLSHRLRVASHFLGYDPKIMLLNLSRLPAFLLQAIRYQRLNRDASLRVSLRHLRPILNESSQSAGSVDGHYFHQDLWAARKIFCKRPARHVDVGSRIDGFISHLLVFMPVCLVDIRPFGNAVKGLSVVTGDATELPMLEADSIESLSSLHAAEHFGLGRYSDPVDPDACARFMKALQRVLAPGGRLYFSVPIGHQRVEFNAHRIFDVQTILDAFQSLDLLSFSFVDDGQLYEDVSPDAAAGMDYGCGLFEFSKVKPRV